MQLFLPIKKVQGARDTGDIDSIFRKRKSRDSGKPGQWKTGTTYISSLRSLRTPVV